MQARTAGLTALTPQECLALLRSHPVHVGRLGVTDVDGQPLIMPVNYRLDGDTVVIRTEPDSLIAQRAREHTGWHSRSTTSTPAWQEGWSILIQGRAETR